PTASTVSPSTPLFRSQAGGRPIIHSDDPGGIQRLNQEAAKAMYAGQRAGIPVTRDQALRWITLNPAWAIGLDSIVGTLEPGKMRPEEHTSALQSLAYR